MASGRKSPNMISMTGRRPLTALPKAAPDSASSEIGVSKTRSAPCLLVRGRRVVAKTPPATATSSPKKMTGPSRSSSSSSAWQIAVRKSVSLRPTGSPLLAVRALAGARR